MIVENFVGVEVESEVAVPSVDRGCQQIDVVLIDAPVTVEIPLFRNDDLVDPSGRSLVMSSATASYVVETVGNLESEDDTTLQGTIAGNLLLDPAFRQSDALGEAPLILLD